MTNSACLFSQLRLPLAVLFGITVVLGCSGPATESNVVALAEKLKDVEPSHKELVMFDIPADSTMVETVITPQGNGIAMVLRLHDAAMVLASGYSGAKYDGFTQYQEYGDGGFAWHVARPSGPSHDVSIAGSGAEQGTWLDWGSDNHFEKTFHLSSTGEHVGFTVYQDGEWKNMVDFVAQAGFDSVGPVNFSPNGLHHAYVGSKDDNDVIVIDGAVLATKNSSGPPVDTMIVARSTLTVTDSGKTFFVLREKEGPRAVWAGEIGPSHSNIGNYSVHKGTDRFAYSGEHAEGWSYFIDGKQGATYEKLGPVFFSENGERYAYVAYRDDNMLYVLDGVEQTPFHGLTSPPEFAPVGSGFTYGGATKDDKWSLVRDGELTPVDKHIYGVVYSADGKHLAHCVVTDTRTSMYLDGKQAWSVEGQPERPLRYDSELKQLGVVVSHKGKQHAVINGEVGPGYPFVVGLNFSNEGDRYAYIAGGDDVQYLVEGPSEIKKTENPVSIGRFSARDNLAVALRVDGDEVMRVDDKVVGTYEKIYFGVNGLGFRDDGMLEYLARKQTETGSQIVRVLHQPGTGPL